MIILRPALFGVFHRKPEKQHRALNHPMATDSIALFKRRISSEVLYRKPPVKIHIGQDLLAEH
jgi:hypothetical protein